MGTVIALIIFLTIVVGIGEAIAPLIAVMFLVVFLGFIICMMTSASKESQKKSGFYIIKDQFFEDMNDPYLKGNKSGNRPHYYCF